MLGLVFTWTLTSFVTRHYPVKMITIILAMVLLGVLRVLQHVHSDPQNQQLIYEYYKRFVKHYVMLACTKKYKKKLKFFFFLETSLGTSGTLQNMFHEF